MRFVHDLITLYIWILIITAFLSWIPVQHSQGGLATTKRILRKLPNQYCDHCARSCRARASVASVSIFLFSLRSLFLW